ncbi:MAG: PAS domain-containing protein, partial [Chloroflexota bacterium]
MTRSDRHLRYSIRFRVIAPLMLAGILLTSITYLFASWYMSSWQEDQMQERAEGLHAALQSATEATDGGSPELQAITLAHASDDDVEMMVVVDRDSEQVIASTETWTDLNQIPDPIVRREIEDTLYGEETAGEDLAYFYVDPLPGASSGADRLSIIQLNGDSTERDAWLATWAATGAAGMIALFVVGLTHSQLTRHVIEPVTVLDAALRQAAPPTLVDELGTRRDEIGALARSLGSRMRRSPPTIQGPALPAHDTTLTFEKSGKILAATIAEDQDVIPKNASVVNSTLERHLPADVANLLLEEFDALCTTGEPLAFEFEHRAYGFTSVYEGRARAFTPDRVTFVFRDMTDYKQVEREIEAFEERVNRVLYEVPPILTTLSTSGEIRFSNRTPFGRDDAEVVGRMIFEFLPADQYSIVNDALDAAVANGEQCRFQVEIPDDSGSATWSAVISPVLVGNSIDELVMTAVEMTEQRKVEQSLQREIERLESEIASISEAQQSSTSQAEHLQEALRSAGRQRDELTSRLQEIASAAQMDEDTALAIQEISRSIDMLERTALNESQRRYLASIRQQTQSLATEYEPQLVELGSIGPQHERMLIPELADDVIAGLSSESTTAGVSVRGTVQPGMPISFIGDAERIQATLQILTRRALGRSEVGPVEIVVSQEAVVAAGIVLRFDVYDDRSDKSDPDIQRDAELNRA